MNIKDTKEYQSHLTQVTSGASLEYVPDEFKTSELCLAAVQKNGIMLQHVLERLRTEALCSIAVINNGLALDDAPINLRSKAICLAAVQNYEWAIQYAPEAQITEEMAKIAVERNGLLLRDVPVPLRSESICITAIQSTYSALSYVRLPMNNLLTDLTQLAAWNRLFSHLDRIHSNANMTVESTLFRSLCEQMNVQKNPSEKIKNHIQELIEHADRLGIESHPWLLSRYHTPTHTTSLTRNRYKKAPAKASAQF